MKNILITITLGLTLTACGGSDTPPKKDMTIKELASAAAAGDKAAMAELEQKAAKGVKEHNKKLNNKGDSVAVFQKALLSKDNTAAINALASAGNPNAQHWNAVTNRQNANLSEADKQKYSSHLESIAATGDQYMYLAFGGSKHSLSAEAAFNISEDLLSNKGLYSADTPRAITYLRQAANGGQPEAMLKLATRYQYALDMDKNLSKARFWLERSAAAGNRTATDALKNWKNK